MPDPNEMALLGRMERQAQAINGPGMGTTIKYRELRGLLDIVGRQAAELAMISRAEERGARRSAATPVDLGAMTVPALRTFAAKREVDLPPTAVKKIDIIAAIEAAAPVPVVSGSTVDLTADLIRVFADLLETKAELWGQPALQAIEAWEAQGDRPLPVGLKDLVAAALHDA